MKRALAASITAAAILITGCGGTTSHQAATGSHHPAGWGKPAPATVWQPHNFGLVPTGVMFDSIDLSQVPASPFAVAGYTAGHWPNYLKVRTTWPHTHAISIAISANYHADCLDIEPGDATPAQAPGWVTADIKAGFAHPCVYSSYYEFVNQVRPALAAAHIARASIYEWDADYRGCNGAIDQSFDATQCTDNALGRNLDESNVTLQFLSIAQPPYQTAKPLPLCIHHRMSRASCAAGKTLLAKRERALHNLKIALTRTTRSLHAHHCQQPYRRAVCRDDGQNAQTLGRRVRWYTQHAHQLTNSL